MPPGSVGAIVHEPLVSRRAVPPVAGDDPQVLGRRQRGRGVVVVARKEEGRAVVRIGGDEGDLASVRAPGLVNDVALRLGQLPREFAFANEELMLRSPEVCAR